MLILLGICFGCVAVGCISGLNDKFENDRLGDKCDYAEWSRRKQREERK